MLPFNCLGLLIVYNGFGNQEAFRATRQSGA